MESRSGRVRRVGKAPARAATGRHATSMGRREAGLAAVGLAGPTVLLAVATRASGLGRVGLAGAALLVGAKMLAVVALGAMRGMRPGRSGMERASAMEAVTLGSLLAFVASLALGRVAPLPSGLIVADWAATLAVIASAGRRRAVRGAEAVEPEVMAAFQGRSVAISNPSGGGLRHLRGELARLGPAACHVMEGRWRPGREATAEGAIAGRADLVIRVLDGEAPPAEAVGTRRLVAQALRTGAEAFVLVTRGAIGRGPTLSERIVASLAGLTPSRLVRVRLEPGLPGPEAARRILRVAARGRDGLVVDLGRDAGAREIARDDRGGAEQLWAELDRIEGRPGRK